VDKNRLTQVGRALMELGVQMIAAYSPQARGRSGRSFGTWQGRLPQELRLAGIRSAEGANVFLRKRYIGEFNSKFSMPAAEKGTAFRKAGERTWTGYSVCRRSGWWRKTTRWPSETARGRLTRPDFGTAWQEQR
jgi:hypothetical protein